MTQDELRLGARFVMEAGKPRFVEGDGLRHYSIELFTSGADPCTESITYRLDDTYYDPVREVFRRRKADEFAERITSCGDQAIVVSPSGAAPAGSVPAVRALLSKALERTHAEQGELSREVLDAIEYIRRH